MQLDPNDLKKTINNAALSFQEKTGKKSKNASASQGEETTSPEKPSAPGQDDTAETTGSTGKLTRREKKSRRSRRTGKAAKPDGSDRSGQTHQTHQDGQKADHVQPHRNEHEGGQKADHVQPHRNEHESGQKTDYVQPHRNEHEGGQTKQSGELKAGSAGKTKKGLFPKKERSPEIQVPYVEETASRNNPNNKDRKDRWPSPAQKISETVRKIGKKPARHKASADVKVQQEEDASLPVNSPDKPETSGSEKTKAQDRSKISERAETQDPSKISDRTGTQDRSKISDRTGTQNRSKISDRTETQDPSKISDRTETQDPSIISHREKRKEWSRASRRARKREQAKRLERAKKLERIKVSEQILIWSRSTASESVKDSGNTPDHRKTFGQDTSPETQTSLRQTSREPIDLSRKKTAAAGSFVTEKEAPWAGSPSEKGSSTGSLEKEVFSGKRPSEKGFSEKGSSEKEAPWAGSPSEKGSLEKGSSKGSSEKDLSEKEFWEKVSSGKSLSSEKGTALKESFSPEKETGPKSSFSPEKVTVPGKSSVSEKETVPEGETGPYDTGRKAGSEDSKAGGALPGQEAEASEETSGSTLQKTAGTLLELSARGTGFLRNLWMLCVTWWKAFFASLVKKVGYTLAAAGVIAFIAALFCCILYLSTMGSRSGQTVDSAGRGREEMTPEEGAEADYDGIAPADEAGTTGWSQVLPDQTAGTDGDQALAKAFEGLFSRTREAAVVLRQQAENTIREEYMEILESGRGSEFTPESEAQQKLWDQVRQERKEKLKENPHLILVNKWHKLPEDYVVEPVELENGQQISSICYDEMTKMLQDCREAGGTPIVCSGYRPHETQVYLFDEQIKRWLYMGYGQEEAEAMAATAVAVPGTSEHELGLAADIYSSENMDLDESQVNTFTQQWLMEHSWEYGFILRYPNGKSSITGIIFEPWHYRYVGKKYAGKIYNADVCLEEYLDEAEHPYSPLDPFAETEEETGDESENGDMNQPTEGTGNESWNDTADETGNESWNGTTDGSENGDMNQSTEGTENELWNDTADEIENGAANENSGGTYNG